MKIDPSHQSTPAHGTSGAQKLNNNPGNKAAAVISSILSSVLNHLPKH